MYRVFDLIPDDKLNWSELSTNPAAIQLLEANPDKIDWSELCSNPAAIHLIRKALEANPDDNKINWTNLSGNRNPAAISLLESNYDKIVWSVLCRNPTAIHFIIESLESTPGKINWYYLSDNPAAIQLLEANPDNINWPMLSWNHGAIQLLEANPDKINWDYLSENPAAIHLLNANPDKINWNRVPFNKNARHLKLNLKLNIYNYESKLSDPASKKMTGFNISDPEIIHLVPELIKTNWFERPNDVDNTLWGWLCKNPAIFDYDYDKIRHDKLHIKKGIVENRFHPKNMKYFKGWGYEDFDEFEENI